MTQPKPDCLQNVGGYECNDNAYEDHFNPFCNTLRAIALSAATQRSLSRRWLSAPRSIHPNDPKVQRDVNAGRSLNGFTVTVTNAVRSGKYRHKNDQGWSGPLTAGGHVYRVTFPVGLSGEADDVNGSLWPQPRVNPLTDPTSPRPAVLTPN